MASFGVSLYVFLARSPIDTFFFWQTKGIEVVHIWTKFHLCLICGSQVFKI